MTLKAYALALALAPAASLAGSVIIDIPELPTVPEPVVVATLIATLATTPAVADIVADAVETLQTANPGSAEAIEAVAIVVSNIAVPPNLTPVQVQAMVNILTTLIASTPAGSQARAALQRQLTQLL